MTHIANEIGLSYTYWKERAEIAMGYEKKFKCNIFNTDIMIH